MGGVYVRVNYPIFIYSHRVIRSDKFCTINGLLVVGLLFINSNIEFSRDSSLIKEHSIGNECESQKFKRTYNFAISSLSFYSPNIQCFMHAILIVYGFVRRFFMK